MKQEIEHRWRELGEYVREQRRLGQLSLRHLSELSGVSNPYLSQIERGLRRPSAGILQQLARALHISAETLYVRAGMLDDDRDGPDDELVDAIRRSSDLDEDQKRSLVHIYESFRLERLARLERTTRAERPVSPERKPRASRGRRARAAGDTSALAEPAPALDNAATPAAGEVAAPIGTATGTPADEGAVPPSAAVPGAEGAAVATEDVASGESPHEVVG